MSRRSEEGEIANKLSVGIHQLETRDSIISLKEIFEKAKIKKEEEIQIKLLHYSRFSPTAKNTLLKNNIKILEKMWSQSFVTETRSIRSSRTLIFSNRAKTEKSNVIIDFRG